MYIHVWRCIMNEKIIWWNYPQASVGWEDGEQHEVI